ncbi:MAG: MBL fold metallo-hydrolase [Gemmatimonadales bacterium]|jgi:glyoxylase-like metal-dependent hydrolase (beta-lactamase superfamily II)
MLHVPSIAELTPPELMTTLERGEPVQILDIRAPHRVAQSRIDVAPAEHFHNIVGSQLIRVRSPREIALHPDLPVAVVCGHGNDSKIAAAFLSHLGYSARSLQGGMAAWMAGVLPRELPAPGSLQRIVQFDRFAKGALGYVLISDGEALVIDPPRDVRPLLTAVEEAGARVVGIADTHCHADYLSGGPALAAALTVPYYLHPADAVYPYDGTAARIDFAPLAHGQTIAAGSSVVRVVHTPGHTEGSVTLVADERAAFTGDFLFVHSVGRPDLAGMSEGWTGQLWSSLEAARRDWPVDYVVYPAHYAAEAERNDDRTIGRALADLREVNEPFGIASEQAFRDWVAARSGTFPDAYRTIKAVNLGLQQADAARAEELEVGRNECALR